MTTKPHGERNPAAIGVIWPSGVTSIIQPRHGTGDLRGAAKGDVQGEPQVAVGREHGPEGILVVAAGDRNFGDGLKHVGAAVAVGVLDAGELLALRDIVALFRRRRRDDAERLVEPRGEEG